MLHPSRTRPRPNHSRKRNRKRNRNKSTTRLRLRKIPTPCIDENAPNAKNAVSKNINAQIVGKPKLNPTLNRTSKYKFKFNPKLELNRNRNRKLVQTWSWHKARRSLLRRRTFVKVWDKHRLPARCRRRGFPLPRLPWVRRRLVRPKTR
jgi:hypothetical protein